MEGSIWCWPKILLCCFWYWRKGVEMSGGKGREWMRFWDKDFDRWKLVGQDFGSYFISNSRWGPLLCGIIWVGTWCLVHERFMIHLERYMRLCDWDTFWAKLSSVSLFIWNAAVKIGTFDGFVVNLLVHSFWIVITIDKETILICFYCTENLVVVLV